MRKAIGLAAAVAALVLAAPAQAVVQASATLERTGGNGMALVVVNTGDEAFQEIGFTVSEIIHTRGARTAGGTCTQSNFNGGFNCESFNLAPGQTRRFLFETESPYPTGGGGALTASQATPGTSAGGPFPVEGPTSGTGGGGGTPVVGKSELVRAVRGTVKVRQRGRKRFVRLRAGQSLLVKDRSEIDTTRGQVQITVAANRQGATSLVDVSEGRAIIDQNTARNPTTTFKLSAPLACPRGATAAKRKRKRKIFVHTNGGRIKTRGNWASGTASGTAWRTVDTCTATTIQVTEGTVIVRDIPKRRNQRITAPGTYTARKSGGRVSAPGR